MHGYSVNVTVEQNELQRRYFYV